MADLDLNCPRNIPLIHSFFPLFSTFSLFFSRPSPSFSYSWTKSAPYYWNPFIYWGEGVRKEGDYPEEVVFSWFFIGRRNVMDKPGTHRFLTPPPPLKFFERKPPSAGVMFVKIVGNRASCCKRMWCSMAQCSGTEKTKTKHLCSGKVNTLKIGLNKILD